MFEIASHASSDSKREKSVADFHHKTYDLGNKYIPKKEKSSFID